MYNRLFSQGANVGALWHVMYSKNVQGHETQNLFLSWYSWKIAELPLNNNHSLTHSNTIFHYKADSPFFIFSLIFELNMTMLSYIVCQSFSFHLPTSWHLKGHLTKYIQIAIPEKTMTKKSLLNYLWNVNKTCMFK